VIIDSQIHAYEANTPKRPWRSVPNWPPSATGDEQVAAMDKLGPHDVVPGKAGTDGTG
jgi:L-fuconolactonase